MSEFRLKYRRATFLVSGIKGDRCQCCGLKPKKKGLHFHHRVYAYSTAEVRKHPQLALENTMQLCYRCHKIADALRITQENPAVVLALGGCV
jgi:5-methylcytosine-specific restriction endonuclease McrA